MSANKCVRSVTPLSPNDFKCLSNVSQCCSERCHACPFATTCNPLQIEYMKRKISDAIEYLNKWNDGAYIVTVDTNDFDVLRHCYDLRSVIAGLYVILCEALGRPLGDVPRWENQYPVVVDEVRTKRQKGRD